VPRVLWLSKNLDAVEAFPSLHPPAMCHLMGCG
jgi:hypothetical protein